MSETAEPHDGPEHERSGSPEHRAATLAWQAGELLDRRRVEQARQLLQQALQEHPDSTALWCAMARADYLADRLPEARATLGRLIAADPGSTEARWWLFLVEMASGRHVEAEALVLGLLRENPRLVDGWCAYSTLMIRALQFEKARDLAKEAARLAPDSPATLRALTLCDLVEGRATPDAGALARLLANDPQDLHTLRMVVVALSNANRLHEAQQVARQLLRLQPDDPGLLESVLALRARTHWSMAPLRPLQRWGWTGSVVIWLLAVVVIRLVGRFSPMLQGLLTAGFLAFVVYSWVWPPLLDRIVRRQAR